MHLKTVTVYYQVVGVLHKTKSAGSVSANTQDTNGFCPANAAMRFPPTIPRIRFRTSTLLWVCVVVAAFFVGRQSDEIGLRLQQLWKSVWPNPSPLQTFQQPNGRVLIKSKLPVARVQNSAPNVCTMNIVDGVDYEILPIRDGKAQLTLWLSDGSAHELRLVSENGALNLGGVTKLSVSQVSEK
jgi:hypothetical protein